MTKTSTKKSDSKEAKDQDALIFMDDPETDDVMKSTSQGTFVKMAPHPRLGSYAVDGPVTGNHYEITRFGTEVDYEDAIVIASSEIQIPCMRTGGTMTIHPAGITT